MERKGNQVKLKQSNSWLEIRKKSETLEIISLIAITILVGIGIICDCFAKGGHIFFSVENYSSYILTIIQVQATVGTLIFAIIALISGNMSESYKGVSISDYYLNIKPWVLTQKILIIILLFMCFGESILYVFHFYNTAFFMFAATLIVILVSILEVYSAFEGRNRYVGEINAYLEHMIKTEKRHNKGEELFCDFVKDWVQLKDPMDQQSYDEYKNLFLKFMHLMCKYNTYDSLNVLQKQSYIIDYHLLGSAMIESKIKGIDFLNDVYENLWSYVFKSKKENYETFDHFKNGFFLFAKVYEIYMDTIRKLSVEDLQVNLKFSNLIDRVLRMDCHYKEDDRSSFEIECSYLNVLARFMGKCLNKPNALPSIINQSLWRRQYDQLIYLAATVDIPQDRQNQFFNAYTSVYFYYSYGLIENGLEDVVINGLYLSIIEKGADHQYQAFFYLSFHTFVYYLAIRGEDNCIPSKLRNSALKIWNNNKVKTVFRNFIDDLATKNWLKLDLLRKIQKFLLPLERFPDIGLTVKWMMMEIIATDFYLFIVLYLGYYFFRRDLIENNIDEENMWTYIANESTTKEMLKDFYKSLINEEVDDETINSLYDILAKVIKDQRRIRLIREAESHQNTYEKLDIEELKNNIRERLSNSIKETFESIYDESLENTATKSIDLEKINTTTEQIINTDILKGQYQLIHARLLFHIIQYLDKANLITKRERNKDFRDDVAYMRYLKENNISILMGDRNVLINQSYNMYAEFNKHLEHFKSQFLPFRNFGIGLEEGAVLFKVNSIDVSISSSSIKDEGIRYDEESNKYMYDSSGITIDFDENEIKKFVYNDYKTVNISANISINVNKKCCGTVFYIEDKK